MDTHSLQVLEFPAIREILAAETDSPLGRERALALRPTADPDLVLHRLGQTREARALLAQGGIPSLGRATDIRPAVERAAVPGACLSPSDLAAIADAVEAAVELRQAIRRVDLSLVSLVAVAAELRPPIPLAREVRRCLRPDGGVADSASPTLLRLRAQTRQAREEIREGLQALLAAPHLQGVIAEPVITLRNDRYVIPLLPQHRASLPGIVQDQSGSGHTLFVEPLSVVEQNNAIRRQEREAEAEVERILLELTGQVRSQRDDLRATLEALAELDVLFAKARLAERWGAEEPRMAADGRLRLRGARHPLLVEARRAAGPEAEPVIPIDVALEPTARVLVVTGPNAGGKTVALKTVGLLALLAQSGLPIPASPDSELPVFAAITADIGDEQSIAADLSTFSAHMVRLRTILTAADRRSLVLVDEIGAGTDPGEGAALGNAVLEALAERGAWVLATTHLDGIKLFVSQDPRMVNAAVEFDLDRMRPVYRLHIGLPGRSFAIDVACRLGIPTPIVQRARELVGDSGAGIAALLNRLHALERTRMEQVTQAEADRAAAAEARTAAEGVTASLRQQLAGLQRQTRQLVAEIAADARRRVEAILAEARQARATAQARQAIRDLPQAAEARLAPLAAGVPGADAGAVLDGVTEGQPVWVRTLGQLGTVLGLAGGDGLVEVQLPLGKTRIPLADLGPAAPAAPRPGGGVSWSAGAGDQLTQEINVIGCTVEEAEARVSRYLEDAVLGGLARVRIIHGKGTGRLRRGIAALLKTHPLVSGFQLATFDEGGSGATIVEVGPRDSGTAAPGRANGGGVA